MRKNDNFKKAITIEAHKGIRETGYRVAAMKNVTQVDCGWDEAIRKIRTVEVGDYLTKPQIDHLIKSEEVEVNIKWVQK